MPNLLVLQDIELVPVLELEPMAFASAERSSPAYRHRYVAEEWHRYWLDSLADAGIIGLEPLYPGSWHVPTQRLTDPALLHRFLTVILEAWGGPELFTDPDSKPVLGGGLALLSDGELIARPTCCSDLGDLAEWRQAAARRDAGWHILWIGHPWLSVRYERPWLVLSDLHESDTPTDRWLVCPDDLQQAGVSAEQELASFAGKMEPLLRAMGVTDSMRNTRQLAGLENC